MLDVGCGAMRAGVHLVRLLESGHYYGVDIAEELLDAGYDLEIGAADRTHKLPRENLVADGAFEFTRLPARGPFDMALAVSLFTHLRPTAELRTCLTNLAPIMRPGGVFHATFFVCPDDHPRGQPLLHHPGDVISHAEDDPFHYYTHQILGAADGLPWQVAPPRNWDHPRAQLMVRFTRLEN